MNEKRISELEQYINSLTIKPTELESQIETLGKIHEGYLHYLIKIETAVQPIPIDNRHRVCDIVIEWLTSKVKKKLGRVQCSIEEEL